MRGRIGAPQFRGRAFAVFLFLLLSFCFGLSGAFAATSPEVFRGAVEGSEPEVKLLRDLVETLRPESLELVLEGGPDASGSIRRLYLEARGSGQGALRVDAIRLEALFVKVDLDDGSEGLTVVEAVQGYFEGRVTEKDLNDCLLGATLSAGSAQWRDLRLDLRPGGFSASARFASGAISAFVEISSRLAIRDRDRLVMEGYQVSVNNSETDMAQIVEAIEEAQPLLDFRDFPFPVRLRRLKIDDDSLLLATATAPTRFEGRTLRYEAR